MKIFVLCNSDTLAFPTLTKLNEMELLAGVGIVKSNSSLLKPAYDDLSIDKGLYLLERKDWVRTLKEVLIKLEIDVVWVLTFPWKVPGALLSIPPLGFINFHFGILPKYKGIDPVFWQIKNREKNGGLTVHLMNEEIDEGPVLLQETMPIIPGETYGLHCQRLGQFTMTLATKVKDLQSHEDKNYVKLDPSDVIFDKKPLKEDLSISWDKDTSEDIEWLVNASNPKYRGINTKVNGMEMRLIEVTPVNMEESFDALPGEIVHADAIYGLIVRCCDDEFLRITVVEMAEGCFSGVKMFNLGIGRGHKFE